MEEDEMMDMSIIGKEKNLPAEKIERILIY
jgi:hypothetical protein